MHIILPQGLNSALTAFKRKFLPRSLFFRTMLLIFVPLIVVQIVSVYAYWNSSWSKVGKKLSENLAQNMAFIITTDDGSENFADIQRQAQAIYDIDVQFYDNENKHDVWRKNKKNSRLITGFLTDALAQRFPMANTEIFLSNHHDDLNILVDMEKGLYVFKTPLKNIFSTSIFGFVAWMIATSLLLFIVAVLFLRVQARSITQLAAAAEDFGKGINTKFKPYGSIEVRRAGLAFVKMKERILRQISERTQMLAGVSHDLRFKIFCIHFS